VGLKRKRFNFFFLFLRLLPLDILLFFDLPLFLLFVPADLLGRLNRHLPLAQGSVGVNFGWRFDTWQTFKVAFDGIGRISSVVAIAEVHIDTGSMPHLLRLWVN
jgi:hypothetical protein